MNYKDSGASVRTSEKAPNQEQGEPKKQMGRRRGDDESHRAKGVAKLRSSVIKSIRKMPQIQRAGGIWRQDNKMGSWVGGGI